MKIHVHIEQDEGGYFVAEVPALPGCLSQGKTKEDAIRNIQEAVEGWLEVMDGVGMILPDPKIKGLCRG